MSMTSLSVRINILIDTGLQFARTRPNGWQARTPPTLIHIHAGHHVQALDPIVWLVQIRITSTAPGQGFAYIQTSSVMGIRNVRTARMKISTSTDVMKGTFPTRSSNHSPQWGVRVCFTRIWPFLRHHAIEWKSALITLTKMVVMTTQHQTVFCILQQQQSQLFLLH